MKNSVRAKESKEDQSLSIILTICVFSLFFIFLIYSENIVFGSVLGDWVYRYFHNWNPIPYWIPVVVIALVAMAIFLFGKLPKKFEFIGLVGVFFISIGIQVLLQKIYPYSLDELIPSNTANSFYTVADKVSGMNLLAHFQDLVLSFGSHARSNMPGKTLFFSLLMVITKDPQILGYLVIAFSALGGLLIYGVCKNLFKNQTAAFYAFILYSLIPCKQEFLPVLNTVTPIFILLSLYLLVKFLQSKKHLWLILLGFSLYLLILFEPSPLVTGLIFLSIILHGYLKKEIILKDIFTIVFFTLGSFAVLYLLFRILFSFDLISALRFVFEDAVKFNLDAKRSYPIWLRENVKEFFFAAGIPVMGIFTFIVSDALLHIKKIGIKFASMSIEFVYSASIILTFVIVLFLGINRGETTRLWIYLSVFFQIPVALFLSKMKYRNYLILIIAFLLVGQSIVSLQRVGFIIP